MGTFIYAKCDATDRLALWEDLIALSSTHQMPWIVGGDFNIVLEAHEKLGGLGWDRR